MCTPALELIEFHDMWSFLSCHGEAEVLLMLYYGWYWGLYFDKHWKVDKALSALPAIPLIRDDPHGFKSSAGNRGGGRGAITTLHEATATNANENNAMKFY